MGQHRTSVRMKSPSHLRAASLNPGGEKGLSMPADRTLGITATPTLIWNDGTYNNIGATMAYTQTSSVPNMPNKVDKKSGQIDLSHMPSNSNYTNNVDIIMTLDASALRDLSGNPLPAQWSQVGDITSWTGSPPTTPWCWFCANPPPGSSQYNHDQIDVLNMTTVRNSDSVVFIDDNTLIGTGNFTFCLGLTLLLPTGARYFITIDPAIVGKGVTNK